MLEKFKVFFTSSDCRHEALSILDSKFAQQSTLWLTLKCEDRRGILSEVSRLISSHDMSIKVSCGEKCLGASNL